METGVIIATTEHTDGNAAMKDDANRPQKRTRLAWTFSLLLLPLAAGSGAQDSLRWRGSATPRRSLRRKRPSMPFRSRAAPSMPPNSNDWRSSWSPTKACRDWR